VGKRLSIADVQLFDLLDINAKSTVAGPELAKFYPNLLAYHARIAAVPEIKAYLAGPQRFPKINNNGLGEN
jgi:glutathione S-transferase